MSTTIEIIPVSTTNITFGQVIDLATININNFLNSIGVNQPIVLSANLHENGEKYIKPI